MASKKTDGGVRLGARLDIDTAALMELLAFATNENSGRVVSMALLALLDSLPKTQRETISRAMPLRQASLSRLRKLCGPSATETHDSTPELSAGQGSLEPVPEVQITPSRVNPLNRMSAIKSIASKSTGAPIDQALAVSYGSDRPTD